MRHPKLTDFLQFMGIQFWCFLAKKQKQNKPHIELNSFHYLTKTKQPPLPFFILTKFKGELIKLAVVIGMLCKMLDSVFKLSFIHESHFNTVQVDFLCY